MPILDRTSLNTSDKLHCLAEAINCQAYGDISRVSSQFDISRKTIRKTRQDGLDILNLALGSSGGGTQVVVDTPHLKRSIIALAMTGVNSIRAIEDTIPLIYPGVTCSFGYIQGLLIEAQTNAAEFNSKIDLSNIISGAIDELFCLGDPVLAGICLDSGFLFSLAHEKTRGGDIWKKILKEAQQQGLELKHVVKDGGKGMTKGVNDVFDFCEQRDDAFHALYITLKAVSKVEKRAYRLIEEEYSKTKKLQKAYKKQARSKQQANNQDEDIKKLETELALITQGCNKAVTRYEHANTAYHYLHRALSSIHTDMHNNITLMSPKSAQTLLKLSVRYLKKARHPDCNDAARYIKNRLNGLTLATADFYQKQCTLCRYFPQDMVTLACYFFEYKRSLKKMSKDKKLIVKQKMLNAYALLRDSLGETKADRLMQIVEKYLTKRHRASSAIEGFNSLLRPYLYVRKGVNQGFLELFKAWHNLRTRRSGRFKGTSAYETLTGKAVDDWLTLLGFPPSKTIH
jgi:hypothetical protein